MYFIGYQTSQWSRIDNIQGFVLPYNLKYPVSFFKIYSLAISQKDDLIAMRDNTNYYNINNTNVDLYTDSGYLGAYIFIGQ